MLDSTSENDRLYPGSAVTVLHANLLLMQYSLKHSLTKVALADLLNMVRTLLPAGNKVPSSFYAIKKYFEAKCSEVSKLKSVSYCSECHRLLGEDGKCPNHDHASKPSQDFLYIPLKPQLERMAKGMCSSMYTVQEFIFCVVPTDSHTRLSY